MVIIAIVLIRYALGSLASSGASYSNLKRQQREDWERTKKLRKENYENFAKKYDCYWNAAEDPHGIFFPDTRRHYDGTPR